MAAFERHHASIGGVETHYLTGGKGNGPVLMLLHGGSPGLSPFCGGTHLWGGILDRLAETRRLIVPDLLGSGETGPASGLLTIDAMAEHIIALIEAESRDPVHLLGHDLGGLVALWVAITSPKHLASLTIVSSNAASPTGDGVENLSLISPPAPLWSADSQGWAYDRLSYSHHHIDEALIEASVAAAGKAGHQAYAKPDLPASDSDLFTSIMRTKSRFFRVGREEGVQVPTQIIWAKNDPLVSVDHGVWLYRIIAAKQRAAQFHLINRSGSFPFREQPDEFLRLLLAFEDGLMAEAA
ncbi:Pimeloyl-ACP methyl ester carboxylesterase [Xaviernesmea oryzae]|uniref:Pimeloyl-ACP methyl ester carboxylesterase n=1 Tax=Xaviernesmea oryzae TaxID=464029 RepID=A0A1X7G1Q4_9HYPH|nr:alpha/beta hydrolase [Xaviernesmea oryzae]SMF62374.1 Pimeloyl-ACP methyl ester carboxylesterase [Xaviernesmea oryzae]